MSASDRFFDAVLAVIRKAFPWLGYCATYEYSVFTVNGGGASYDLGPVALTAGLPPLPTVAFKPGMPGLTSTLQVGSLVYVTFINHDPTRPFIVGVSNPQDPGFVPTSLALQCSAAVSINTSGLVHAGGQEPANPVTAPGRFVRWGDTITGPTALSVPLVLVPTGAGTQSQAGS